MSNNAKTKEEVVEITDTIAEKVVERPYTLRKMKDGDLFPVLTIISKVFPEDELSSAFAKVAAGEKKIAEIGVGVFVKLVLSVIKNIPVVRDELYDFLSDVSGIPATEIPEMEFGTTPLMIWDIANEAKNASFFKVLSKLL